MGKMVFDVTNELDDFKKNASDALGLFGKVAQAIGLNLNVNTEFNKMYFDKPFAERRAQLVGMAAIRNLQQVINLGKEVHNSLIRLALQSRIVELAAQIGVLRLANIGFVRLLAGLEAGAMAAAAAAKMAALVSSKGYFVAGFSVSIGDAICEISGRCPPALKSAMKALGIWFQATTTTKLALTKARSAFKARGGFLGDNVGEYVPAGALAGQAFEYSCVAGACKMVGFGEGVDLPESVWRELAGISSDGVPLRNAAEALTEAGIPSTFRAGMSVDSLALAAAESPVIVTVKVGTDVHALVVDKIVAGSVFIRDPWPLTYGTSYSVTTSKFLSHWTGKGVTKG
jgi:hypothetical protein